MKARDIGLALCSETWGENDKKSYQYKLEHMLEIDGLSTVAMNRKMKRGGGVMVIGN